MSVYIIGTNGPQQVLDFTVTHDMTDTERSVWYALRRREGPGRAIKAEDLAELVGISERNVQRAVHALINERGKSIGSSMTEPFGYYVAVTPEQREEAAGLHRRRALAILATSAAIVGVTLEEEVARFQTQLELVAAEES